MTCPVCCNTMAIRCAVAACFVSGVAAPAVAGVILDGVADAFYLDLANEPQYDAVGKLTWDEPGGSFLGSGTLIADSWVLTAAHNVDGSDGGGAGLSNLTFILGGTNYAAEEWIIQPTWSELGGDSNDANYFTGYDIALVRLASVPDAEPAELYTGNGELGQLATTVGFGATGVGSSGFLDGTSGSKRAGQNVVDVVGSAKTPGSLPFFFNVDNDRLLGVDFDSPTTIGESKLGSNTPVELEYLIAPGDSGGGLFIDVDGQTLLAGVTSFGQSTDLNGPNSDYGDLGGFTRVSSFTDWIWETIDGESASHAGIVTSPVLPLPGDYSGDGLVDPNDYLLWQQQYGQSGDALAADGNGDGVVNAADYTVWRDNLHTQVGNLIAAQGVPEPTSTVMAFVAATLLLAGRLR